MIPDIPIEWDLASVLPDLQQFFANDRDNLAVLDVFEQIIEKHFNAAVQHWQTPIVRRAQRLLTIVDRLPLAM
jgi:hypothetical protein